MKRRTADSWSAATRLAGGDSDAAGSPRMPVAGVGAEVDSRREELAQLWADSLRVPAENPLGDTRGVADYYSTLLARSGLLVERFDSRSRRACSGFGTLWAAEVSGPGQTGGQGDERGTT